MNFASAGISTPAHILMMLLVDAGGIKATNIPYRRTAPAAQATVSGEVKAGAVISPGLLPQAPTVAEVGLKGMEFEAVQIAMVPAVTLDDVLQILQTLMLRTLQQPEIRARLQGLDMQVIAVTGKGGGRPFGS